MEDKNYRSLIKAIKNSNKIGYEFQNYLLNYVNGVRNGTRENDFIDEDILMSVVLGFVNGEIKTDKENESLIDKFNEKISSVKFMLPEGEKTPEYESVKRSIMINKQVTSKELYSILGSRIDYEQIMNLISSDKLLKDNELYIFNYAIEVSPYCINVEVLKREIIAFMNGLKNVTGSISEYSNRRLIEAKKRCGVYPIDEYTLASISETARRAESMVRQLENMQSRLDAYDERSKLATANGLKAINGASASALKKLQEEIETAKAAMIQRLDEYLVTLEQNLKASSDQIFNSILKDTQESLKNIKVYAQSINNTTTGDLLRIKKAAEDSVASLKNYMENEPELRRIIEDAAKSVAVKDVLLNGGFPQTGTTTVVENPDIAIPSSSTLIIPGYDRPIVPQSKKVVIPTTDVDTTILPAFDESIPFEKRFAKIMKEKEKREKKGEIFHELVDEVLICLMEGFWPYLYGPSGCGKSYIFKQAASLLGLDYVENGKIEQLHTIMAYTRPNGAFAATQTFIASLYGKLISYDEMDSGNTAVHIALSKIYDAMRDTVNNPSSPAFVTFAEDLEIPMNPNFRMIGAGNTNGDGENEIYNARGKLDESVQQRMKPKAFSYDNRIERYIFSKYPEWYKVFVRFREACDLYAASQNYPATPGLITTRDGADIVRVLNHNSQSIDCIIRENFTQKKDIPYLRSIAKTFMDIYGIPSLNQYPLDASTKANSLGEKEIAKCLVYRCLNPDAKRM